MATVYESAARQRLHARIDALTPELRPKWGRMNVGQMVVHVDLALRHALGELPCNEMTGIVSFWPLKMLIIYVFPTPKGVPTMDEIRDPLVASWIDDRVKLKASLDRMGALPRGSTMPRHAAFGRLSYHAYGTLAYNHVDHHLKQFGV